MVVIFEGMDNCLKDTSINLLKNYFPAETHVLKCSSPPTGIEDKPDYQKRNYSDMFRLIELSELCDFRNIILNRSHFGEYVYSQIYRGYRADWVFELEKEFLDRQKKHLKIILVLLIDSDNNRLKKRDDGRSLSDMDNTKLNIERSLFLEAFEKCNIDNKVKFDLSTLPMDKNNQIDISVIIDHLLDFVSSK